jgi:hypothetical protein
LDNINREWLFRELRRSLSLLAADGSTALAGVPDGCCKPDELSLEFDNVKSAVLGNFATELPTVLLASLAFRATVGPRMQCNRPNGGPQFECGPC